MSKSANVRPFAELGLTDLDQVGGKNASLGEMVANLSALGVKVPDGFATTADAFRRFIGDTGLAEEISSSLRDLDTDDTQALAEEAEAWERGVDELSTEDPEVAAYVRQLEEAKDTADLPEASGESIAREFERYLKKRRKD